MNYLTSQAEAFPEQAETFTALQECYQKKLWFQMGGLLKALLVEEFFITSSATSSPLLDLHNEFITKFADTLKGTDYALLCLSCAKQTKTSQDALAFLEKVTEKLQGDSQALMMIDMAVVSNQISVGELEAAKEGLEKGKKAIEDFAGIMDGVIQSTFYRSSMEYYRQVGPAELYFKNAMLYLTYTELSSIPKSEQSSLARDVALSALVGENIYNFGELIQHPIIKILSDGADADDEKNHGEDLGWLSGMLFACNTGDIAKFEVILNEKATSVAELQKNNDFLLRKVRIMSLMEFTFRRPSNSRTLTFDEVSQRCCVANEMVEMLLMKCFSLKVIKGVIDQVDSTVQITWVQPRVLDNDQIISMKERLLEWADSVDQTSAFINDNSGGL